MNLQNTEAKSGIVPAKRRMYRKRRVGEMLTPYFAENPDWEFKGIRE